MPAYVLDPGLESIGSKVIQQFRKDLSILKIGYMFRAEATVTDGKVIAGRCIRVDDRNWALHKKDFLIEIARDVWDEASPDFKLALMDHELGHCGIRLDEAGQPAMDESSLRIKVYTKQHDIEEFEAVLKRHGAYHENLRTFLNAFAKRAEAKKTKPKEKDDD